MFPFTLSLSINLLLLLSNQSRRYEHSHQSIIITSHQHSDVYSSLWRKHTQTQWVCSTDLRSVVCSYKLHQWLYINRHNGHHGHHVAERFPQGQQRLPLVEYYYQPTPLLLSGVGWGAGGGRGLLGHSLSLDSTYCPFRGSSIIRATSVHTG